MPGQQQQQQAAVQTTTPVVSGGGNTGLASQSRFGNSFLQDQMKERQSVGRATWQGALGDTLGAKLYDALAPQLTDGKLLGHANAAVDSALNKVKAALAGQAGAGEAEAVALLVAELDKALKQIAQDAVVGSGLSEGIRDTVDAHPYEIALAAAAGAVAYVLSNQDLPLLESKLGLGGGHSLVAGIDPGRTMQLALEQVRVGYRYQGDRLAAHLYADKFQDGFGASGGVRYSPTPDSSLALEGSHTDRGGVQRSRLDLTYMNPSLAATVGVQRNVGGENPGQSIGASLSSRGGQGELQRSLSGTWRDDGSWEAAAGIGKTEKDRSWSVEAFGGRDARGNEDMGVRAMFKLRF